MSTHPCPHPDCDREISHALFACAPHWRQLPAGIKLGLRSAWRKIINGDAAGIEQHDAAADEAIAWWSSN